MIPKSFELSTEGGAKIWVHGNATEHIAEYAQMVAKNNPPDSDYYTLLFEHVANQLGRPPLEQLQNNPRVWDLFRRRNGYYRLVDELGYQPIPEEAYQAWRKSVEAEKEKKTRENPWKTLNLSDQ